MCDRVFWIRGADNRKPLSRVLLRLTFPEAEIKLCTMVLIPSSIFCNCFGSFLATHQRTHKAQRTNKILNIFSMIAMSCRRITFTTVRFHARTHPGNNLPSTHTHAHAPTQTNRNANRMNTSDSFGRLEEYRTKMTTSNGYY